MVRLNQIIHIKCLKATIKKTILVSGLTPLLQSAKFMENTGLVLNFIPVDSVGRINMDKFRELLDIQLPW